MTIRKGTQVKWEWGNGEAEGKVQAVYKQTVEKELNGSTVKRKATKREPAYLIEQADGSQILKSKSEVKRAS